MIFDRRFVYYGMPPPSALLRLIRPKQWIKNLFVFAPLVFAQDLFLAGVSHRGELKFAVRDPAASLGYFRALTGARGQEQLAGVARRGFHQAIHHRPLIADVRQGGEAGRVGEPGGVTKAEEGAGAWRGLLGFHAHPLAPQFLIQDLPSITLGRHGHAKRLPPLVAALQIGFDDEGNRVFCPVFQV